MASSRDFGNTPWTGDAPATALPAAPAGTGGAPPRHPWRQLGQALAHDLRPPLRAINGFAALIAADPDSRLSPDSRERLDRIASAATQLGDMITRLLELVHAQHAELVCAPVDLNALVADELQRLAPAHPHLRWTCEPLPTLHAQPQLLTLAVRELLAHAAEHAPADRPHTLHIRHDADRQAWCVHDRSRDLQGADPDTLLDPFPRSAARPAGHAPARGLAVAARVVERHGGRLWIEARSGFGVAVWVYLPTPD
ncbi:sensor histidine kinase [Hydrogenophaga sp. T2]|uniref:sensor histidine kinase n=1 Tax=Hydrogenophaga sp. T2 TaxID=3132823 RepID=UPI003CFB69F7